MALSKMAAKCLIVTLISIVLLQKTDACKRSASDLKCCTEISPSYCYPARKNSFDAMPECPNSFSPTFKLHTRNNREGRVFSDTNIPSEFSNNIGTVFLVHGWQQSIDSSYLELKEELLNKDDLNVITVDWREGALSSEYFPAAANTETIGALIGTYANVLRERPGSKPYFWCIGHSIGAHGCGYTSQTAQPLFDRITGSDPAQSGFASNNGLLCSSARKVDVIHTDPVIGSLEPRGNVDFYPNGGKDQPGCTENETDKDVCNHAKSLAYLTDSISNPDCYIAVEICSDHLDMPDSCRQLSPSEQHGVMGYNATRNRYHGNLYFTVDSSKPNCTVN